MNYNSELLGTVNNLFDVDDRMGVELMGATKWNGLKRAVVNVTANAIKNPIYAQRLSSGSGADALTRQLFGLNDALGVELLGSKWYEKLGTSIKDATHSVLNAGSKIPYVSDAVSDVRSVANIFKKSSSANDSANAAISNVSEWIQANKLKTALILGGTGFVIYKIATRKKRK